MFVCVPYLLHYIHEDQKTTWGVLLYHSSYESYGLNSVHLEEVGCQKIGLNDYGLALFLGGALKFIPVAIMLLSTSFCFHQFGLPQSLCLLALTDCTVLNFDPVKISTYFRLFLSGFWSCDQRLNYCTL